jgi:hypothetical protein
MHRCAALLVVFLAPLGCAVGTSDATGTGHADASSSGNSGDDSSAPSDYDSGPPATVGGDDGGGGGPDTSTPATQGDGGGTGSEGGTGGTTSCTSSSDCPGLSQHDNVGCTSSKCTLSCQGEFYDINADPADGCEYLSQPSDKHTEPKAIDLGSFDCNDSDSAQNLTGTLPSDKRVHENPSIDGFDSNTGSAPFWYTLLGTGSGVCQNDANFDLQMNAVKAPSCYRMTLITDKSGTQVCNTDSSGHCSISNSSGSYGNGDQIYLWVERANNAGCTPITNDEAGYHISGHL